MQPPEPEPAQVVAPEADFDDLFEEETLEPIQRIASEPFAVRVQPCSVRSASGIGAEQMLISGAQTTFCHVSAEACELS